MAVLSLSSLQQLQVVRRLGCIWHVTANLVILIHVRMVLARCFQLGGRDHDLALWLVREESKAVACFQYLFGFCLKVCLKEEKG